MDATSSLWPSIPITPLDRVLAAQLRHAAMITLEYLNEARTPAATKEVQKKATYWASRYFGTKYFRYQLVNHPTFLDVHPDIFNLNVPCYRRLRTVVPQSKMVSPNNKESAQSRAATLEGPLSRQSPYATPTETEPFPELMAATPASGDQLNEIVDLRPRRNTNGYGPPKISPEDLHRSRLLTELPEFMGRLADSNRLLEAEAAMARAEGRRPTHRLELEDDEAQQQEHIDVNVFTGILEEQPRRKRKIIFKKRSSTSGESERESNSPSAVSINQPTKRKHMITEVPESSVSSGSKSGNSESDGYSQKRQKRTKAARAASTASTSSSEAQTTSSEESISDEGGESSAPASANGSGGVRSSTPSSAGSSTAMARTGSRDSNLSINASSQGTRIRLVGPMSHAHRNTASPPKISRPPSRSKMPSSANITRLPSRSQTPSMSIIIRLPSRSPTPPNAKKPQPAAAKSISPTDSVTDQARRLLREVEQEIKRAS